MPDLIRPFGPAIMIDRVSTELVALLNRVGDQILSDPELSQRWDWSHMLAGNVHKEVLVAFSSHQERDLVLAELSRKCIQYYDAIDQQARTTVGRWPEPQGQIEPDDLEFCGMWFVSQHAGDFNPRHHHGGDISGVLYLCMPKNIEEEWQGEKGSPSAGLIEFSDGRPSALARTAYKLRPEVGMIALFPSWLAHTVYPFRSEGERRSMSFNVVINKVSKKAED